MKKLFCIILVIVIAFSLVACGNSTKLSGDLSSILDKIYAPLTDKVTSNPYSLCDTEMDSSLAEFWLYLTSEDFATKIEKGVVRQYEVTAITHATVLVEFTQEKYVKEVFDLVKSKSGLNKFGCLPAECGIVATSGKYLVLIYGQQVSDEYSYGVSDLYDNFCKEAGTIDNYSEIK